VKVEGHEVSQDAIDACIARMKNGGYFRAFEIEGIVERAGLPKSISAMRVADRIIQRERKAGNITTCTIRPYWKWVGPK
jgi:hypothetical protein